MTVCNVCVTCGHINKFERCHQHMRISKSLVTSLTHWPHHWLTQRLAFFVSYSLEDLNLQTNRLNGHGLCLGHVSASQTQTNRHMASTYMFCLGHMSPHKTMNSRPETLKANLGGMPPTTCHWVRKRRCLPPKAIALQNMWNYVHMCLVLLKRNGS